MRPRRTDPLAAPWRQFVPAMQLWIWLLAVNGALGLASHAVDTASPWYDVAATTASGVLILGYCWPDRSRIAPLVSRSGMDDRTWWQPLLVLVGLPAFLHAYFWVLESMGAQTGNYSDDYISHGWPTWSIYLMVSILPAILEELAFRGFILDRLDSLMGPREAIAVQGAMFAVLHMSPLVFPSHFVFGVAIGWLRRSTGSLHPGIAIHCLWNAWVLLQELHPT